MGIYACTGSASGIGASIVSALEMGGHSVITVDLRNAEIIADLSSFEGRHYAIDAVRKKATDGLDGFIPAAGVGRGQGTSELITSVNYFGAVEMLEGLRDLLEPRKGSVVLIGSNSAPMPRNRPDYFDALLAGDEGKALEESKLLKDAVCYMLGKRALVFWMQQNVMAYARAGIRVNIVAPGPISTPMTTPLIEEEGYASMMATMLEETPLKRMGEAEEVASVVLFLLGLDSGYVCGSVLFVDGGHDAHARQGRI